LPGSQKYVCFNMGSNLPKKSPRMGKLCPRYFGLGPKCRACRNYSLGLNYFYVQSLIFFWKKKKMTKKLGKFWIFLFFQCKFG
jgi:hypothetical protein